MFSSTNVIFKTELYQVRMLSQVIAHKVIEQNFAPQQTASDFLHAAASSHFIDNSILHKCCYYQNLTSSDENVNILI
jgi:hypothetical protein